MNNQNFNEFATNLFEGVYVVDKRRKILFWNSGAEKITGYTESDVTNSFCYNNILNHVDDNGVNLCKNGCPLMKTLQTGEIQIAKVYLHHKDGHRVPVDIKTMPLYDENNEIIAVVEVFTDHRYNSQAYEENRKLNELLVVDTLTNIPNRRYLDFTLENFKKETDLFNNSFAILFFDIDHFKNINDTYGHNVGDGVLKMVSSTLKSNLRGDDVIGRWGGEEFIGIIKSVNEKELFSIAEKLRVLTMNSTYHHNDQEIKVTISIGGTKYIPGESIEEVIERADSYMYESKSTGRNKSTIK